LATLLDEEMWNAMLFEEGFDFQATMFQPVGGMDRIPEAFARRLGATVRRSCEVTAIRRAGWGARVEYRDRRAGKSAAVTADYCLITIPLKVLKAIPADFAPAYAAAIAGVDYRNAIKIAWEAPRFWETEDHIYGGISWVKGPTALVWYPSDRFFAAKGVLLGGYTTGASADELAAKPLSQQFALSRAAIEALHPGHGRELAKPMAVAWSNVAFSLGIAARWRSEQNADYALLNEPDGPFHFCGEHLSRVGAWQEGAILSARRAINLIDAHRRARHA